jgi:outer membrane protein OmpA-like peptidoglycan-associated protein
MAPDDLPVPLAAMPANPPKPYGVKQAPAPAAAPTPAQPSMAEEAPAEEAKPAAPETVEQAYQRRLAEFARQDVPAAAVVAPVHRPRPAGSGATQVAQASDDTIHLVPPAEGRKITEGHHADGVRPLSQFPEGKSSNSFDVAALTFAEGTMELTGDDKARLKEVAKLAKDTHGSLRILGRSTSPRLDPNPGANQEANRQLARQRADAVARELVRLGVPASKVYAGPADSIDQLAATDATDIVLDY